MKRFLGRLADAGWPIAPGAAVFFVVAPSWGATAAQPSVAASAGAAPAHSAPAVGGPAATASPRDNYTGPPLLLGSDRKIKVGAYGGFGGAYTRMIGKDSGLVSFEAALLLDHRLSLGVAGYGFTRTPRGPATSAGTAQQFGAGYGGLAIRYSVFGSLPVYGTFGLVLGAGAVNLHRDDGWDDEATWDDGFEADRRDWDAGRFDPFLFVQPEIALNTNVTRWLRLGATVGYRFTGGVGRFGLSEGDLNAIVAGGNIGVGWF
jgi:hypothetical protein